MFYTIYKTINTINNKFYIGMHQTENLDDGYLGSGKHLKRAIRKYGIENFKKEILYVFDNEQDMRSKEKELVTEEFLDRSDTYNLCPGGKGGFGYINKNELNNSGNNKKRWKKISETHKQKYKNPIFKKKMDKITSKNLKNAHISGLIFYNTFQGKTHTEETKQKMSESSRGMGSGKKNSQYGTIWITNGTENKKIKKVDTIPEGWYKGRKILI